MKLQYKDTNNIILQASSVVRDMTSQYMMWPLLLYPNHTNDTKDLPNYRFLQILAQYYRKHTEVPALVPAGYTPRMTKVPLINIAFTDMQDRAYDHIRNYITHQILSLNNGFFSNRTPQTPLAIRTFILHSSIQNHKTIPKLLHDLIKCSRAFGPNKDALLNYTDLTQFVTHDKIIDDIHVGIFYWKEYNYLLIIERPDDGTLARYQRDITNYNKHQNYERVALWTALQVIIIQLLPGVKPEEVALATTLNNTFRAIIALSNITFAIDIHDILSDINRLYYTQEKVNPLDEYYKQFRAQRLASAINLYDLSKERLEGLFRGFLTEQGKLKEYQATINGIELTANTPTPDQENFLLALESLPQLTNLRIYNDVLLIDIEAPVTYDIDMLKFVHNSHTHALIKHIEAEDISMVFHQTFSVNSDMLERNLIDQLHILEYCAFSNAQVSKNQNPHLKGYGCLGDHRADLMKALKANNMLSFILILIQATSQINLNDSTVVRWLGEHLDNYIVTTKEGNTRSALLYMQGLGV